MYVLTDSNLFELQQGISDSLTGRCGVIGMASFSHVEKYGADGHLFSPEIHLLLERENSFKLKYRTRSEVFQDIFEGGMPDIVTHVADRDAYFKSYISTYIEKDVKKLLAASSELQFRNFLSIISLSTAQELHFSEIAGSIGLDV